MKTQHIKQNGAALVVGLIMLLVMTLIGVSSMNSTRTELKIANNFKNHSNAFQTAALMFERALVDPILAVPATGWLAASLVPLKGSYASPYESTSGSGIKKGTLRGVVYLGCRKSVTGSSILGNAGAKLIHEVSVTGDEQTANRGALGVSRQFAAYTTTAAGCP